MAKITTISDDLDGSSGAETLRIRVGEVMVEIDLAPANRDKLMKLLEPYFTKGRTLGNSTTSDTGKMREWLRAHGHQVGDKGRIPEDLQAIYNKAQAE